MEKTDKGIKIGKDSVTLARKENEKRGVERQEYQASHFLAVGGSESRYDLYV